MHYKNYLQITDLHFIKNDVHKYLPVSALNINITLINQVSHLITPGNPHFIFGCAIFKACSKAIFGKTSSLPPGVASRI